ncbi:alpha/beta-hydrolase [Colletotrichum zoysiae]|uniref:Alpha/beta-hydrolase n=1 Tax=Colletotrichum zoysiae TaxID=1216348 RepID=A0AAD9HBM5_9PEZI|nr:alpha/beta-hydrolase [Colletotrichum zoysiae]
MGVYEEVEFKTVDGINLRGRLYAAQNRGPGVVMGPGLNITMEMSGIPNTAEAFQSAGITALVYDHRGVGASDGSPRNNINPFVQMDDMSDAITFLSSRASVDPKAGVGLWGLSLGGSVAMVTAALDPRVRFVVAVAPITEIAHNMTKLRPMLAKAAKDRESQVKGNEPFYVPMLNKKGENPAGFNPGFDQETVKRLLDAYDELDPLQVSLAPNHLNRTTVGTYRYMLLWDMDHMWKYIVQPVLFLLPRKDQILSVETQMAHYNKLGGPKQLHIQEDAGHMDILDGPHSERVNDVQSDFIRNALDNQIPKY